MKKELADNDDNIKAKLDQLVKEFHQGLLDLDSTLRADISALPTEGALQGGTEAPSSTLGV